MTTSGVVNATTIEVANLIERAVRKCGVMPSILGGEQLLNATDSLGELLIGLSNRGVNLWCVDKRVRAPAALTTRMRVSADTVNLLNVLYRIGTYTPATDLSVLATAVADYGAGNSVNVVSVSLTASVAGDFNINIASSDDGVVWTSRNNCFVPGIRLNQTFGADSDVAVSARFWRATETVLTTTVFISATFVSAAVEYPMSQMSRDEYTALPNKNFSAGQNLQYFFDKQVDFQGAPGPFLWLWPTLQAAGPQVVMWIQRQIQDVGDLSNTLDIPTRWITAVTCKLASLIALELPKELVSQDRLDMLMKLAETEIRTAEDGEIDGGPLKIQPNIRGYTR